MKRKNFDVNLVLGILIVAVVASCKKNNDSSPTFTVPDTYTFDNVEYAEASGSMAMWAGFTSYLGKAAGRQLSADTATYLWNNTNNAYTAETSANLPFTVTAINAFDFNLSGNSADQIIFKQFIDSMVNVSKSFNTPTSPGSPGKIGTRLVNYSGLEFNQLVAKGLMGALQLDQVNNYLNKSMTDDNNTVTPGKGTAMQHDWDLAFGYVGIPTDYDSARTYANTEANRPLALGGYFRERGRFIQSGGIVFEAFRKGRAAINAKDYARRDEAIGVIQSMLEKTMAAAAYEYAGLSQGSPDLAVRLHAMSECYGFLLAMKYRAANTPLTTANYQTMIDNLKTNFYELIADPSNAKLKQVQDILSATYGQLQ